MANPNCPDCKDTEMKGSRDVGLYCPKCGGSFISVTHIEKSPVDPSINWSVCKTYMIQGRQYKRAYELSLKNQIVKGDDMNDKNKNAATCYIRPFFDCLSCNRTNAIPIVQAVMSDQNIMVKCYHCKHNNEVDTKNLKTITAAFADMDGGVQ